MAAVADGMKAWEVMRARAYAFDLVLTEVAMPTLSGIQLLARIVAADECKNIPVISKLPHDPSSSRLIRAVVDRTPLLGKWIRLLRYWWLKRLLQAKGARCQT